MALLTDIKGVRIMGPLNLAGGLAVNASNLYARNLFAFLAPQIDGETGALKIDWEDETVAGTLIARDGEIVHPMLVNDSDKGS